MNRKDILLAEDDVDDYRFLAEAFEKISSEYVITRVRNGLECVKYLKTGPRPDIVFLDLNIPGINGLECLQFIKNNESLADIPVVIYSTSHYIKHIDSAFKNRAQNYIVKPSNADALVEILAVVTSKINEGLLTPCKENFVMRTTATLEG